MVTALRGLTKSATQRDFNVSGHVGTGTETYQASVSGEDADNEKYDKRICSLEWNHALVDERHACGLMRATSNATKLLDQRPTCVCPCTYNLEGGEPGKLQSDKQEGD